VWSSLPEFVRSTKIHAPVEKVFAFHEREDALRLLSPAFPPVSVIRKQGGIERGALVELQVGPFVWVALHTGYRRNRFFQDEQISGPFARWVHRHEFEAIGDATLLTDRIDFQLPGGRLVNRLFGWIVRPGLNRMFRHRHLVTKRYCEQGS